MHQTLQMTKWEKTGLQARPYELFTTNQTPQCQWGQKAKPVLINDDQSEQMSRIVMFTQNGECMDKGWTKDSRDIIQSK